MEIVGTLNARPGMCQHGLTRFFANLESRQVAADGAPDVVVDERLQFHFIWIIATTLGQCSQGAKHPAIDAVFDLGADPGRADTIIG